MSDLHSTLTPPIIHVKKEFCWVCMGPWSEHGTAWYNCSRYEEKGGDAVNQDAQSKSRASLERYLHVSFVVFVFVLKGYVFSGG